jgi:hypothetical protein
MMSDAERVPCRHLVLDPEAPYTACTLREYKGFKYWERGPIWTEDGGEAYVQFCELRGRIHGITQCYKGGRMSCFEEDL